jgi:hypothetical protein
MIYDNLNLYDIKEFQMIRIKSRSSKIKLKHSVEMKSIVAIIVYFTFINKFLSLILENISPHCYLCNKFFS